MRSGNGRHRRPRQAPALFVTAGVTGAGLAMPLLAAGSAQAADGATWDRVASCESGGLWSANSGNGYYGGLQLTLQTWEEYGGTALADRPDLASRGQQIEVAEKILDDRGPDAWPTCSVSAGLLPEDADLPDAPESPDVEVPDVEVPDVEVPDLPGVPDGETTAPDGSDAPDGSELPEVPEESSGPEGSGGNSASPAPVPEPSQDAGTGTGSGVDGGTDGTDGATTTQPTTQPTPSPTAPADGTEGADKDDTGGTDGERTGRHRGSPDDEARGEDDRSSRGRHGTPGEDGRQDGYLVRPGDSLSQIAAEQDVRGGWTELYEANRETVGSDPDLILPGQRLRL